MARPRLRRSLDPDAAPRGAARAGLLDYVVDVVAVDLGDGTLAPPVYYTARNHLSVWQEAQYTLAVERQSLVFGLAWFSMKSLAA